MTDAIEPSNHSKGSSCKPSADQLPPAIRASQQSTAIIAPSPRLFRAHRFGPVLYLYSTVWPCLALIGTYAIAQNQTLHPTWIRAKAGVSSVRNLAQVPVHASLSHSHASHASRRPLQCHFLCSEPGPAAQTSTRPPPSPFIAPFVERLPGPSLTAEVVRRLPCSRGQTPSPPDICGEAFGIAAHSA